MKMKNVFQNKQNLLYIILAALILIVFYILMSPLNAPVTNTRNDMTNDDKEICAQIITYAKNPKTGICEQFPTPCDIPEGYTSCGTYQEEIKTEDDNTIDPDTISLFYGIEGKQNNSCTQIYEVKLPITKRYATIEVDTLVTLLNPLPKELKEKGYYSAIPEKTRLLNLTISKGKATANFNDTLNQGGGSCANATIYSQIEKTLLQFPEINEVEIQINGSTQDVLQP